MSFARAARFFLFMLAFILEVRVHAAGSEQNTTSASRLPGATHVTQEPEGCLEKSGPCAIATGGSESFVLKLSSGEVRLDRSTAVVRTSEGRVRLMAGMIWVVASGAIRVSTEFGEALLAEDGGEMWISRTSDKMSVTANANPVEIKPLGLKKSLAVERGFENFMGRVGSNGHAETGVPTPIVFRDHVARWGRLYTHGSVQFEKDLRKFHGEWVHAGERAAEFHKSLFERKLAAIDEEKARKDEARRRLEKRDQGLRQLFRKRALEEF